MPRTVFYAGPGVLAPELIPSQIPVEKIHHCKKLDGSPVIAVVVDANGNLSHPWVTEPADGGLNELALAVVGRDEFKPGTHDGMQVAVAIKIEVELKTCSQSPEENGESALASLRERPTQRVTVLPPPSPEIARVPRESSGTALSRGLSVGLQQSDEITAPLPLNAPKPHYTEAARKAKITGTCVVRVIVDAEGKPRDAKIVKSLDPGLDQQALNAVMQYRFKPAMRRGQPVPVQIALEIGFSLY
jgi:TonB family protein